MTVDILCPFLFTFPVIGVLLSEIKYNFLKLENKVYQM